METLKNIFIMLRTSAGFGLIIVLPFIIMELINKQSHEEYFHLQLFSLLWILAGAFIFILIPIVRSFQRGNKISLGYSSIIFKGIFLAFIGFIWIYIIMDQMPCFLGQANCD